jgi:hypothetical protein
MKCKKCDRNIADPVSNYCGACIHNAFAELEAKLERAAGDVKWSTEQYADCADELKKARAKNAKLLNRHPYQYRYERRINGRLREALERITNIARAALEAGDE